MKTGFGLWRLTAMIDTQIRMRRAESCAMSCISQWNRVGCGDSGYEADRSGYTAAASEAAGTHRYSTML